MAPNYDRDVRRLLRDAGCEMVRQGKGSHEIWQSPITNRRFPVPIGIESRHTANGVPKQAGLQRPFDRVPRHPAPVEQKRYKLLPGPDIPGREFPVKSAASLSVRLAGNRPMLRRITAFRVRA